MILPPNLLTTLSLNQDASRQAQSACPATEVINHNTILNQLPSFHDCPGSSQPPSVNQSLLDATGSTKMLHQQGTQPESFHSMTQFLRTTKQITGNIFLEPAKLFWFLAPIPSGRNDLMIQRNRATSAQSLTNHLLTLQSKIK